MTIQLPHFLAPTLAFVAALAPLQEASADEGEAAFSLGLGLGGFSVPDHSALGGLLGVDFERGVSDAVWLRASAGGGAFYDAGSPAYAAYSHIGVSYVLDVLRYVPHIDLGVGGISIHGKDIEEPFQPLVELGLGIDLLVSRSRSYGVFARFESFLSRSAFFSVGARTTWRWGFF